MLSGFTIYGHTLEDFIHSLWILTFESHVYSTIKPHE